MELGLEVSPGEGVPVAAFESAPVFCATSVPDQEENDQRTAHKRANLAPSTMVGLCVRYGNFDLSSLPDELLDAGTLNTTNKKFWRLAYIHTVWRSRWENVVRFPPEETYRWLQSAWTWISNSPSRLTLPLRSLQEIP